MKSVFKTKSFDRWAKKVLPEHALCQAARDIERGMYEADLGQGVCKKRIATQGQGKRGAARALVAKESHCAIIFIVGREKSEPGADFSENVVESAKSIASALDKLPLKRLREMAGNGLLKEICNASEKP